MEMNAKMGMILTYSSDICVIWTTNQNNSIYKSKSLLSEGHC